MTLARATQLEVHPLVFAWRTVERATRSFAFAQDDVAAFAQDDVAALDLDTQRGCDGVDVLVAAAG
jgi:hypothetical protein